MVDLKIKVDTVWRKTSNQFHNTQRGRFLQVKVQVLGEYNSSNFALGTKLDVDLYDECMMPTSNCLCTVASSNFDDFPS